MHCLVAASDSVASLASVSNGSCSCWLSPLSCSSWVELAGFRHTVDYLCSLGTSPNSSSIVASHSYEHGPRREHCFPGNPLLPRNRNVCRAIPWQWLSLLCSQFLLWGNLPQYIIFKKWIGMKQELMYWTVVFRTPHQRSSLIWIQYQGCSESVSVDIIVVFQLVQSCIGQFCCNSINNFFIFTVIYVRNINLNWLRHSEDPVWISYIDYIPVFNNPPPLFLSLPITWVCRRS